MFAAQTSPLMRCMYGTYARTDVRDGSTVTALRGEVQKLYCEADAQAYQTLLITLRRELLMEPMANKDNGTLRYTYYFTVRGNMHFIVSGYNISSGNNDYQNQIAINIKGKDESHVAPYYGTVS